MKPGFKPFTVSLTLHNSLGPMNDKLYRIQGYPAIPTRMRTKWYNLPP